MKKVDKDVSNHAKPLQITSFQDSDTIVELIFDADKKQSQFAIFRDGNVSLARHFKSEDGIQYIPLSAQSDLLTHRIVLFAYTPQDYISKESLLTNIRAFIHRYVDVTRRFEKIVSYYVLLTWIYDALNEVPYIRVRGDFGSGKTRFLNVIGALCYKPILASGASTVAPIFHMLHSIGGTLVLDEADFRFSDMKADMVKILNNGTAKGMPVLRCQKQANGEFHPKAYRVYGPKIIATRGYFSDEALESRFISEEMGFRKPRKEIPYSLPKSFETEALNLRNKLLMFRFRNLRKIAMQESRVDGASAPRINQMLLPLLSLMDSDDDRQMLHALGKVYSRRIDENKARSMPALVFEIIVKHIAKNGLEPLTIGSLTSQFIRRHAQDYERKITARWIGSVVRQQLHLPTQKSHGNFVVNLKDEDHLRMLAEVYRTEIQRPHVHPSAE